MPHRITRPWLLLDWVYGMTETASAEIDQKNKLDTFTRKVIKIINWNFRNGRPKLNEIH